MTRVVERVIAVLECFDTSNPALSLHEIAKRVRLPKATVFRLLATLVDAGYIVRLANQDYCPSHKFMRLASVAQRTFSIRDVARPVMLDVLKQSGETIDLSILSGARRVCVDVLESPHPLRRIIAPGEVLDLLPGPSGKILLAFNSELRDALAAKSTSIDAKLVRELEKIRRNGYAYTSGERVEGADGVSVPIRDHAESVRYCLTLVGPTSRVAPRRKELIQLMIAAGEEISSSLGSSGSKREAAA
jgi:DNA-binding IclR family transcriptional regulator